MNACVCSCEYGEPAKTYKRERIFARGSHYCSECGQNIRPGSYYEWVRFTEHDGTVTIYRTCEICLSIRDNYFCGSWCHGTIRLDFAMCLGFDYVSGFDKSDLPASKEREADIGGHIIEALSEADDWDNDYDPDEPVAFLWDSTKKIWIHNPEHGEFIMAAISEKVQG